MAQGGVYFSEGFQDVAAWPTTSANALPFQEVAAPSGKWWTSGAYITNGGAANQCPNANGGVSHIRFANQNSLGGTTADSSYLVTPLATAGIFDLTYYNGRTGRPVSIYKTSDSDPSTTNWVLVSYFPGTGYVQCDKFTVPVNDVNAKRLKIITKSAGDSDLDSIIMQSVGVLPTRFGGLTVQQRMDEVVANWDTYNESHVRGYYLQKSTDGSSFADVNFVTAKNSLAADYSSTDKIKGAGTLYYRVKSVDLDGKTGYGPVARISVNNQGFDGVVVKNPVRGNRVEIQLNGLEPGVYQLSLNSVSGSRLTTKSVNVQNARVTVSMDIPATAGKGIQVLTVGGNKFRYAGKIVVE